MTKLYWCLEPFAQRHAEPSVSESRDRWLVARDACSEEITPWQVRLATHRPACNAGFLIRHHSTKRTIWLIARRNEDAWLFMALRAPQDMPMLQLRSRKVLRFWASCLLQQVGQLVFCQYQRRAAESKGPRQRSRRTEKHAWEQSTSFVEWWENEVVACNWIDYAAVRVGFNPSGTRPNEFWAGFGS
jgi:hypothetical protein